jgi:hypothetical protein
MPREVLILETCDFCAQKEEKTEGVAFRAVIPSLGGAAGKELREVIACEPHRKEFIDPLVELFAEYGAKVGDAPAMPATAPARQRGPRIPRAVIESPCELCKKFFKREWTASNPEALQSHRANTHGITASGYRLWKQGLADVKVADKAALKLTLEPKPLPPGIPDYLKCPSTTCDVEYDPHEKGEDSAFRSLANHTARAHPELPPLRDIVG